jgi:hypothetical protein
VRSFLLAWVAVSLVAVLAHFAFAPRMGLYEDDHWLIGTPMCEWTSTSDWWKTEREVFTSYFHGRPFHCGIGFTMAFFATHIGGLLGAYVMAAAVWALNAGLCLALLWNRFGAVVATVAALVFVLHPADSTHPMLHTAFFVHPSVTFLLLSGIAYSRGRRLLSVVLAGGSLLTYETCFLPALVWPILFADTDRPLWRRLLVHGLAMGAVLAAGVFARVQLGESRVAGAMTDKTAMVKKVRQLAVVGPKSALKTFVARPVWVLKTWSSGAAFSHPGPGRMTTGGVAVAAALCAFFALAVARRSVPRPESPEPAPAGPPPEPPHSSPAVDSSPAAVARLIVSGVFMVVVSYVIALTREPGEVDGRMSSVHIGSTVGWALVVSGVVAGAVTARRAGRFVTPALAAYIGLLAAFHVYVQREYVRAWVAQGEFWRDVVAECPDVRSGTVILYPLVTPPGPMVRHQEWADFMVFPHLFAVPAGWTPPEAYGVGHTTWGVPRDYDGYDWNEVERDGDKLYWRHWGSRRVWLEPGNVILFHRLPDGRFERMFGTVRMAGIDLPLKPREPGAFEFRPHILYEAMFPKGLQPETHRRVSKEPPPR